jgi:predicted nucleotidyltransferase
MIELPAARGHEILRCEVGSTLHGTGLGVALEDHDEMGVYVEWPRSTIGLGSSEHYVTRTAPDGERSQAGDTDLVVYSLRKWARLALNGNPSVILLFFAPDDKIMYRTPLGDELRAQAEWFSSKRSGAAFLGYMEQQRQRMVGQRGRAGRVRVMPDGGVDWKYAMHMLRLGYQGVEFLTTGRLTLPVPGDIGDHLRDVRTGKVEFTEIIAEAESLEAQVKSLLTDGSSLPAEPDRERVEEWIMAAHLRVWRENDLL